MSKVVYDKQGKIERTPKGHFVVYVGANLKRFVVPMSYLKNPSFQELLEESAEVYGFHNQESIILPCKESTFQSVIYRAQRGQGINYNTKSAFIFLKMLLLLWIFWAYSRIRSTNKWCIGASRLLTSHCLVLVARLMDVILFFEKVKYFRVIILVFFY